MLANLSWKLNRLRAMGAPEVAHRVRDAVRRSPLVRDTQLDWNEQVRAMQVHVDQDKARLLAATAALNGVHWQDKRQEWSDLFARYRLLLGELLLLGVGLSAIVLIRKLGWSMAGRVLLANAIALLLAAAVLGWCAMPFTLFGLLALSLVFGIGIDYGLFFAHSSQPTGSGDGAAQERLVATLLAVLLASHWLLRQTPAGKGKIVVAASDVNLGQRLTPEMLRTMSGNPIVMALALTFAGSVGAQTAPVQTTSCPPGTASCTIQDQNMGDTDNSSSANGSA